MVGFGLFSELQNPSNVTLPNLAAQLRALRKCRRATLQRCELSADTYFSSLARFRCRRSICQVVQRALSLLHTKMH